MARALELKNVTVVLEGETLLQNLSFALEGGESLAVIGPNGSGKTVFLKTVLGALPHTGEVLLAPATRIGYVAQKIGVDKHLPLTFENLLAAKAEVLGLASAEIASTVEAVGLSSGVLTTPVGHLSGGQFQKSLVAFALLGRPNLLLFDEPTASIDQSGEEQMYELIHRLQEKYKLTVVLVSHDLSFVYRYATKVLCLNRQNICFGPPQEVLDPKTLAKLYGVDFKYYVHGH
ncbi:metal ABC transporter ATP-binding protein [Candidatus Parcubacteria bacterium]|nr:MAG: metal ABC transporter ATP-binding protein [Candidatus Parcubacteria bacterium]